MSLGDGHFITSFSLHDLRQHFYQLPIGVGKAFITSVASRRDSDRILGNFWHLVPLKK